ncbi:hypothetical protein ACFCY8_10350 [Streptomyces noursei]
MTNALNVTGTERTARILLHLLPWIEQGETRRQYAERLRELVKSTTPR